MKTYIVSLCLLGLFIAQPSFSQNIIASKDFDISRSMMIHDVPLAKNFDDNSVVMLKEMKRGDFRLIKYDVELKPVWNIQTDYEGLNVPQLKISEGKILLISYNLDPYKNSLMLDLRAFDPKNGELSYKKTHYLLDEFKAGYIPKVTFSEDLSKFAVYNYKQVDSKKYNFRIYSADAQVLLKEIEVDETSFSPNSSLEGLLDDNGDLFIALADPDYLRLAGYFVAANEKQFQVMEDNIFFRRPTETIDNLLVQKSGDCYYVAAGGKIGDELIGVNLTCFNFHDYQVHLKKTIDFTVKYMYNLYADTFKASPQVKKSSLGDPVWLDSYNLQEMFMNSENDIILTIEKNANPTGYHQEFINNNLVGTHNTNRKLQKSEDIIIMAIGTSGDIKWDHVIQKYQVFKPYTYSLSYVSYFEENVLSLLTWSKKGKKNFHVSKINTLNGDFVTESKELLAGNKYTYNKNYTTFIDSEKIFVLAQKNNKSGQRKIFTLSTN